MTSDFELGDIVAEFLVESHENLDALDRSLLELERDPTNREILSSIFRTMHTIKGTSGFLGFRNLEALTHVTESLLSRLRDATLVLTPESTSALFSSVDAVRAMLGCVEASGNDGSDGYAELVAEFERLQGLDSVAIADPVTVPAPSECEDDVRGTSEVPDAAEMSDGLGGVPPTVRDTESGRGQLGAAVDTGDPSPPRGDDGALDPMGVASPSTIRVDIGLLDKLMNLVGELVLARNQILQCTASQGDATFVATAQRLNLITSELQEGVMKTRMQPIGTVWSKFPRVVRDLAVACGKEVRLEMEGSETELDKTLIEAIKDPLTHLVRNAVDHGIEAPAFRSAAGKWPLGRISLRAYHEGGHVNIEVADDGAGISTERVRSKALEKALVRPDVVDRMSEREILNLIFLPGFSTAETVTNVSGRGVGMDVVKTHIERIGGTVDVSSDLGAGTTFRVKIPLTLAIIPALIVTAAGDRYAIPQVNLVELVRLEDDHAPTAIELVRGVPVHRLRGNLLPLVNLASELGVSVGAMEEMGVGSAVNIVVLQAAECQFGLVVDGISDTEEIVVKPLGQQLKQVGTFAGATIMGDGRVALILDVMGLAHKAGVLSEAGDRGKEDTTEHTVATETDENEALLLVGVGQERRMAIHLSAVNRLEEFAPSDVERAGDMEVVQYRQEILPLIRVGSATGTATQGADSSGQLQVIVHSDGRGAVGLVVDEILDIVSERLVLQRTGAARGTVGSAVIGGRVTDVIDLPGLIATVMIPSGDMVEVTS